MISPKVPVGQEQIHLQVSDLALDLQSEGLLSRFSCCQNYSHTFVHYALCDESSIVVERP